MFQNQDFEIDVESEEFQRLNPNARNQNKTKKDNTSSEREDHRFNKIDEINMNDTEQDQQTETQYESDGDTQEQELNEDSDEDYVHKQKHANKRSMAISSINSAAPNKKMKVVSDNNTSKPLSMYELKQGFGTATHLIEQPTVDNTQNEIRKTLSLAQRLQLQQQQQQQSQHSNTKQQYNNNRTHNTYFNKQRYCISTTRTSTMHVTYNAFIICIYVAADGHIYSCYVLSSYPFVSTMLYYLHVLHADVALTLACFLTLPFCMLYFAVLLAIRLFSV